MLPSTRRSPRSRPRSSPSRSSAAIGRRGRRGGGDVPLRARPRGRSRPARRGSASTCAACRSSRTSRRAASASFSTPASRSVRRAARAAAGGRGDRRPRRRARPRARLPDREPRRSRPGCSSRRTACTPAGRATGSRGDLDRHEPALRRRRAAGRGAPRSTSTTTSTTQRLVVEIWSWLRGQLRFDSLEAARRRDRRRRRADARASTARLTAPSAVTSPRASAVQPTRATPCPREVDAVAHEQPTREAVDIVAERFDARTRGARSACRSADRPRSPPRASGRCAPSRTATASSSS